MKAAVSIPDPVFKAADELAQRMDVSRSHLYSVAIQRFVQDHDEEAITARLNEVYDHESRSRRSLTYVPHEAYALVHGKASYRLAPSPEHLPHSR